MAARKDQGTLKRMERALDEYVVEPVKKLVGMDSKPKRTTKKAAKKKPAAGSVARTAPPAAGTKRKASPTSRAGGVTRRTAGTPGTRRARTGI